MSYTIPKGSRWRFMEKEHYHLEFGKVYTAIEDSNEFVRIDKSQCPSHKKTGGWLKERFQRVPDERPPEKFRPCISSKSATGS